MTKPKLEDFDNPEGFKRFLLERGSATADEVAANLAISRASYYRLVGMFAEKLYGQPHPPMQAPTQTSASWFHDALVELTEKHPNWGCYRLAEALSNTQKVSGPTIQKELVRLNLDSREKRFARKEKIELEYPEPFYKLSQDEKRRLIDNNPCLADLGLIKDPHTAFFAAQVLEISPSTEHQKRYMLLLVSLNTLMIHLEVVRAGSLSSAQTLAWKSAIATVSTMPRPTGHDVQLLIATGLKFNPFSIGSKFLKGGPVVAAIPKRTAPAALKMMVHQVRKDLLSRYVELLNSCGEDSAKDFMNHWSHEHNTKPRQGFPTFGASPDMQMTTMVADTNDHH